MLRATCRVLKPGGATSFLVIAGDDVPGPRLDEGGDYPGFMAEAGFVDIDLVDVTEGYRATLAAWTRERDAEREAMEQLIGLEDFEEGRENRLGDLADIDAGTARRFWISGRRR